MSSSSFWYFVCLLNGLARLGAPLKFSDESGKLKIGNATGQIAAFADFNSDTATDILILNRTGSFNSWQAKLLDHLSIQGILIVSICGTQAAMNSFILCGRCKYVVTVDPLPINPQ